MERFTAIAKTRCAVEAEQVRCCGEREVELRILLPLVPPPAVVVRMKSGREHAGRVAGFGHYNVEIETEAGPVLLYKAAIESAKFGS